MEVEGTMAKNAMGQGLLPDAMELYKEAEQAFVRAEVAWLLEPTG